MFSSVFKYFYIFFQLKYVVAAIRFYSILKINLVHLHKKRFKKFLKKRDWENSHKVLKENWRLIFEVMSFETTLLPDSHLHTSGSPRCLWDHYFIIEFLLRL